MVLTLRQKIILPTAVVAVLAFALLLMLMQGLVDIRGENHTVREWGISVDHLENAITSARRMRELLADDEAIRKDGDGVYFGYLEHYWSFRQDVESPEFTSHIPGAIRDEIEDRQAALNNVDIRNDRHAALSSLDWIIPQLQSLSRGFWIEKRRAYLQYNETVNTLTTRLFYVSCIMVGMILVLGSVLSVWTTRGVSQRIALLKQKCKSDCVDPTSAATAQGDELDDLERYVSGMSKCVSRSMNSAKLLEVAESERRRIAMDLHDQILADLTHLSRDIKTAEKELNAPLLLQDIRKNMSDVMGSIRAIMDELHPQTLDLLGLDAAIRSYLDRRLVRPGLPAYFLSVDEVVDSLLTDFQKLSFFRIAVEAINNAVRHSHCTRYEVECRVGDGAVTLSVEDNGVGMRQPNVQEVGRGLFNIEQRAKMIGASVKWGAARFSSGTRFELILLVSAYPMPIQNEERLMA